MSAILALQSQTPLEALYRSAPQQVDFLQLFDGKPIILFGAGSLGRTIGALLVEEGRVPVAFADETYENLGGTHLGIPIMSPAEACAKWPDAVWVICVFLPNHGFVDIRKKAQDFGAVNVLSFYHIMRAYPGMFPYYFLDVPEAYDRFTLNSLYSVLADEESRHTLNAVMGLIWHGHFEHVPHHNFFSVNDTPFLTVRSNSIFFDAGAYTGDTLNLFLKAYKKAFKYYIALEPDSSNYKQLCSYVKNITPDVRGKVKAYPCALWCESGYVSFNSVGNTGSAISSDCENEKVVSTTVDSLVSEIEDARSLILKFDIEGAELNGLEGAVDTIRKLKPQLMICVYHKPTDLSEIYKKIKALRSDYSFYLRCHGRDGTDLILYAV